jgi:hypothetical protein
MLCAENLLRGSVTTEQDSRLNLLWGNDPPESTGAGRASAVKFAGEDGDHDRHSEGDEDDDVSAQYFMINMRLNKTVLRFFLAKVQSKAKVSLMCYIVFMII